MAHFNVDVTPLVRLLTDRFPRTAWLLNAVAETIATASLRCLVWMAARVFYRVAEGERQQLVSDFVRDSRKMLDCETMVEMVRVARETCRASAASPEGRYLDAVLREVVALQRAEALVASVVSPSEMTN